MVVPVMLQARVYTVGPFIDPELASQILEVRASAGKIYDNS